MKQCYGLYMRLAWFIYETCMVHIWDSDMVYIWDLHVSYMRLLWFIYETSMVHMWYILTQFNMHVWCRSNVSGNLTCRIRMGFALPTSGKYTTPSDNKMALAYRLFSQKPINCWHKSVKSANGRVQADPCGIFYLGNSATFGTWYPTHATSTWVVSICLVSPK